jgi:hypothetical protein
VRQEEVLEALDADVTTAADSALVYPRNPAFLSRVIIGHQLVNAD